MSSCYVISAEFSFLECLPGFFGKSCLQNCEFCLHGVCHKETGQCTNGCEPGRRGVNCSEGIHYFFVLLLSRGNYDNLLRNVMVIHCPCIFQNRSLNHWLYSISGIPVHLYQYLCISDLGVRDPLQGVK